jgi:hypothetical protein
MVNNMRRPADPNYYMGQLVGEIILIKYLPTLETDMIETNKRVKVTDPEEYKENCRLDEILVTKMSSKDDEYSEAHADWLAHTKMLAKKYLPEKLECRVTQIEITDIDSFKQGLDEYLWDCDVSWYVAKDDFLKSNINENGGINIWCTTIILTRTV